MDGVQLPQDYSHFEGAVRCILRVSMLVFQNLQAKHTVRKIIFSKAAGQDNNITEQRASI